MKLLHRSHVGIMIPQRVCPQNLTEPLSVYLRVIKPMGRSLLVCKNGEETIYQKRGEEHARNEFLNPTRVLTSTVKISGAAFARTCKNPSNGVQCKRIIFWTYWRCHDAERKEETDESLRFYD